MSGVVRVCMGHGEGLFLKHCATSQVVAGSIPEGIIRVFNLLNRSGCTMVLGSSQPLTETSPRHMSWQVHAVGAQG